MPDEPPTQTNEVRKKSSTRKGSPGRTSLMVLFSVTIFVSASLLFLIEPMFAKFVLPSFGGTPAVWTGSMMFFQAALLTSYLYVHATTTWLGARRQAVLHLVVVLLPFLVLPLAVPAEDWAPGAESNPLLYLLGLLAVAIGLPFFAVSATNPLIQRWLADTDHPAARDPYFLYRASNLGSVIGLLGYPLLMEPSMRLANQGMAWSLGYGVLVVLVFASAVMLWRSAPATITQEEEEAESLAGDPVSGGGSTQTADASLTSTLSGRPTVLRRLRWIGLTFVPSSLMLGVTSFVTTDITPIPLLWVIPLSLYLFSFVVVFSPSQRMPDVIHKVMVAVLPLVMAAIVVTTLTQLRDPYWMLILLHILGFFVVAMVLHGEVARDRPPARYLTEFYLWVAVGGVLGGIFNALIAPIAFNTVVEYPLAIVLACLFLPGVVLGNLLRSDNNERVTEEERSLDQEPDNNEERYASSSGGSSAYRLADSSRLDPALDLILPVALGLGMVALGWAVENGVFDSLFQRNTIWQALVGLAAGLCLWFAYSSSRPIRFGLGIAALIVAVTFANGVTSFYEDRSFFGVYKVVGDGTEDGYHALVVGDTNHGAQVLGPQPPEPITYHHRTGPFGQLFDELPSQVTQSSPVAVLGLGAGAMSCYAAPGQQWDFYEIDPAIEAIARNTNLFTYLRDCPGQYDVILGDARLKLAEATDGKYGMIVGEAFSSDAIPVHLSTREAVDMYLSKLQSDGVLVMHISNRHLELEPVVGDLARDRGLVCYAQFDQDTESVPYKLASHFTVLARNQADLGSIPDDPRWQPCVNNPDPDAVWTDDFSNLLSTFTFN